MGPNWAAKSKESLKEIVLVGSDDHLGSLVDIDDEAGI